MILIAFRFIGIKDQWRGVAFGETWEEVFWNVDNHGDPYSCEIMAIGHGSICWRLDMESDLEPVDYEMSGDPEHIAMADGWETPDWNVLRNI